MVGCDNGALLIATDFSIIVPLASMETTFKYIRKYSARPSNDSDSAWQQLFPGDSQFTDI